MFTFATLNFSMGEELKHKQYLIMKLKVAIKNGDSAIVKRTEHELLTLLKNLKR